MVRGNLIETMSEDYIRTARAKGLPERRVIFKHGLRGALTPVVTMLGLDIGLPARRRVHHRDAVRPPGHRAVRGDSRSARSDFPVVMGVTILGALFIAIANLVVDVVVRVPRPESEVHRRVAEPLLEVKDLKVHFNDRRRRRQGRRRRVLLDRSRARRSASWGSPGSGKSVSSLTVMGLTDSKHADDLRRGASSRARTC